MDKDRPGIGVLAIDTRKLIERLTEVGQAGEMVTYEELDAVIGRDVRNGAYGNLSSARRFVQREHQIVFDVVPTVGLKRMSDEEIVGSADRDLRHISKTTRRTANRMTCVEFDKLPREKQIEQNAKISILGAMGLMARPASVRAAAKVVEGKRSGELSTAATMRLFAGEAKS